MPLKEVKIDLRRARDKKEAIGMIYKAIGFEGEAGFNLDALHDVLSTWNIPTRVTFLYWRGFSARQKTCAGGIEKVLNDIMMENRNLIFAYKHNN